MNQSTTNGILNHFKRSILEYTSQDYKSSECNTILTLMTPLGISGSSHCTTTVLELTGLALTLRGGLPGAGMAAIEVTTYIYPTS